MPAPKILQPIQMHCHKLLVILAVLGIGKSEYFVDPGVTLVENFEGWGTSLAWWPDVLGAMPEDVISQVTTNIFSEQGLGLNIVRYAIGGTTPDDNPCGSYRPGGATESYRDGPTSPYNWARDGRQRLILAIAKESGVDTFEAFSNSPPQWMTISGCSKGNPLNGLLHSNFNSARSSEYATYIADVLEHFKGEWGIEFQTYAPFNEPYGLAGIGSWWGSPSNQEGCNMDRQTMTEVIKTFHATFQARNISTELTISDETQIDTAINVYNFMKEKNVTRLAGKVNVHGYWDSEAARRDVLYSSSVKEGHRLWMDEMGWAGTAMDNMEQGLNIANRIVKDIRDMLVSAWVYWQVMEDTGLWGLVSIPYNNASVANIAYNNGYFSYQQFTKYIRKGYSIIYNNEENTVAAYDAISETLVLVAVNPTKEPKSLTYNLELFTTFRQISATRTSAKEQLAQISADINMNTTTKVLTFTSSSESITTLVLKGAKPANWISLIKNGDFEGDESSWTATGTAGVTSTSSWLGDQSGFVRNGGSLSQTVRVNTAGSIFLSARCASNGSNATLSLTIDGPVRSQFYSVSIDKRQFEAYGLQGFANAGDMVTVTFSGSSNGEANIDHVYLHMEAM